MNQEAHGMIQHDAIIKADQIQNLIFTIRGVQVMIDRDLAAVYGVENKRLNEQVKRNVERFPEAFRFQLTNEEKAELVANCDRFESLKHSTVNPYAFTEQGVAMLSAVLRSGMAIQVSISIMKAFVAMRNYITTATTVTSELAEIRAKLALLERADEDNAEAVNDLSEDMRKELDNIYEAIAALSVKVPEARKQPRPIGFKLPKEEK